MIKLKRWFVAVGLVAIVAAGTMAYANDESEAEIKLTDCPAAVQKTLAREAHGATIEEVEKETEDGKTVYEAEVKIDGKEYEIEVAEDGTLLEKKLEKNDAKGGREKDDDDKNDNDKNDDK